MGVAGIGGLGKCKFHSFISFSHSRIPRDYPLSAAGPVFCAGITLYSPLARFGALQVCTMGLNQVIVRRLMIHFTTGSLVSE